jgi:hypothetical protein
MGEQDTTDTSLERALMRFQETRASFPLASEQALNAAILALGQHVSGLRAELSAADPAVIARLDARLDALAADVAALRQTQTELLVALKPAAAAPGQPPVAQHPPLPSVPALVPFTQRPLGYWAEVAAQIDDQTSADELAAHLSKPRVRPEDVQLTPADLARQRRTRRHDQMWNGQTPAAQPAFMPGALLTLLTLTLIGVLVYHLLH